MRARDVHKSVQIRRQQMLPDRLSRNLWDLQDAKPNAGDKIAEVIQECLHIQMSIWGEVIQKTGVRIFGEIVRLQFVNRRLERLHNASLINRVHNLALSILSFCDNTVC